MSRSLPAARAASAIPAATARGGLLALAVGAVVAAAAPGLATAAAPSVKVSAKPIATPLATAATKATIVVRNVSKRRVRGLTLTVSAPEGVKAVLAGARGGKLRRALEPLRPRQTTRVGVRLRRTSSGPERGVLKVKVKRGRKTVARGGLSFGTAPLVGRYFYRVIPTGVGTTNPGIFFTTATTAFRGAAPNGVPSCTRPTVRGDADGCIAYRARGSTLTIDGKRATMLDGGHRFELDGAFYLEAAVPAPGSRLDLVGTGFAEECGAGLCRDVLKLESTGRFGEPDAEQGPIDGLPPDQSGTYSIGERGTLTLAYADGKQQTFLLALPLYPNPSPDFQPDPAVKGFLLDSTFMYGPQTP